MSYSNQLEIAAKNFSGKKGKYLDLGSGSGRESLFMAEKDFSVVSVDLSETEIRKLEKSACAKKLKNIKTIQADIAQFKIKPASFDVISVHRVIHFLEKEKARKVLKWAVEGVREGGYLSVIAFTTNDPGLKKYGKRNFYFKPQEAFSYFRKNIRIMSYSEGMVSDSGHPGKSRSHRHDIVCVLLKKWG
jgi:cyclopropane fatty-acyl-phospholipid synthase-like methyltransferase